MRLLLDTHTLMWWLTDDDSLSNEAKNLIDTEAEAFFSMASAWAIAIKTSLGKLTGPADLFQALDACGLTQLPIRLPHAVEAGGLPLVHRDPFDRMLIAQARFEEFTLMTRDQVIARYQVATYPV